MAVTDAIPDMERELRFFPIENDHPKRLTRDQVRCYNEQGYIFPIDLFTPDEVIANRQYFDKLLKMAADAGGDGYSVNGWHATCQGLYDLVMDERIPGLCRGHSGPQSCLPHDPLLFQRPW